MRARRRASYVVCAALTCTLAAAPARAASPATAPALLGAAGQSLLDRHVLAPGGGWAWRSAIQAPHLQTDRDVGAASVIVGLLALDGVTHDPRYLNGARRAGDWLLASARRGPGGVYWPDHVDRPGQPATDVYTSFDDGVPGIADSLWRLWAATGDRRYRAAALAGMNWEARAAQAPPRSSCPGSRCRWVYDLLGGDSTVRTGIGEGNAGIAYAFDLFAQRTGNARYERYALASASYLESLISPAGAMPWGPQRAHYINGFLSGSAGQAFTFLGLYRHTHAARWLADARRLLAYVRSQTRPQAAGSDWPIYHDPSSPADPLGNLRATGIEEGAAGIGWVELQAWHVTHDPADLATAVAAGDWLLSVSDQSGAGFSWREDLGVPLTHTSLDNGAPGIGWFLHDLSLDTGQVRYEQRALGAVAWLSSTLRTDRRGPFWQENRDTRGWHLSADPSWHWGTAGIAGFLARMSGWGVDMPGEEPGLA